MVLYHDHRKEDPPDDLDTTGRKLYAGGWRPKPYKPKDDAWDKLIYKGHCKISHYNVVRNDENGYSWRVDLLVHGKDYEPCWKADSEQVDVVNEDGYLIFTKTVNGTKEEKGAYIKLPKSCDPNSAVHVDRAPKGQFFVTVSKLGAKGPPEPIDGRILGTTPIPQMEVRYTDGTIAMKGIPNPAYEGIPVGQSVRK